jgi:hypothetical protein
MIPLVLKIDQTIGYLFFIKQKGIQRAGGVSSYDQDQKEFLGIDPAEAHAQSVKSHTQQVEGQIHQLFEELCSSYEKEKVQLPFQQTALRILRYCKHKKDAARYARLSKIAPCELPEKTFSSSDSFPLKMEEDSWRSQIRALKKEPTQESFGQIPLQPQVKKSEKHPSNKSEPSLDQLIANLDKILAEMKEERKKEGLTRQSLKNFLIKTPPILGVSVSAPVLFPCWLLAFPEHQANVVVPTTLRSPFTHCTRASPLKCSLAKSLARLRQAAKFSSLSARHRMLSLLSKNIKINILYST